MSQVIGIPQKAYLGTHMSTTVGSALFRHQKMKEKHSTIEGVRYVMGFPLPSWQRGLVWDEAKKIKFIESLWYGYDVGTYTYVESIDVPEFDFLLIDGQQRMSALEDYVEDRIRVFGLLFSELTNAEKRRFDNGCLFNSYRYEFKPEKDDENTLIDYYNRMNFSGVAHNENDYVQRKQGLKL